MKEPNKILLFDGVCNLCNGTVQFVLRNDKNKDAVFSSLQSEVGQQILKENNLNRSEFDSIIYYRNKKVLIKSTSVLNLLKDMGGIWPLFFPLIIIPTFIRDFIYDWVAKNRYRWFGKAESCMLPLPEYRNRFYESPQVN